MPEVHGHFVLARSTSAMFSPTQSAFMVDPRALSTCVARNGAWCDFRRVPTLEALTRFGVVWTIFLSDSALSPAVLLVALARPCCQAIPHPPSLTIRRTFRSTAPSRPDPSAFFQSVSARFDKVVSSADADFGHIDLTDFGQP